MPHGRPVLTDAKGAFDTAKVSKGDASGEAENRRQTWNCSVQAGQPDGPGQTPISAVLIDSALISSVRRALYAENSGVVLAV
jgi:hypothetical protein